MACTFSVILNAGQYAGAEEVALARKTLDWPHQPFVIPDEIRAACGKILARILAEKRADAITEVRPFLDDSNPERDELRDLPVGWRHPQRHLQPGCAGGIERPRSAAPH